jgi:hypothetical protein
MIQNELRERFKKLRDSLKENDTWFRYQNDLKEEGLKSVFIVPLIMEHLGFSNIDDLKFEDVQGTNQGFADIVVKDNFLFELKKFNLFSDQGELEKAQKQIKKYIRNEKDKIFFGILTDGVLWELFIDKKLIIASGNEGIDLPEIDDECPLCLSLNIEDEQFLNLIYMFNSDDYENNIKKYLVKGIVNKALLKGGKYALNNMFYKLENMDIEGICGKYVQDQVDELFKIERGEYFDQLKNDKTLLNKKIKYEDEYVIVEVEIVQNGHIKAICGNCKIKMEKQIEAFSEYPNFIDSIKLWQQSSDACIYPNRIALYKAIRGSSRLRNQEDILKKWINV